MAFNFGAFVGGLSQGAVAGIEAREEEQREFKRMEKTEAMRQAAESRERRRKKNEATEAAVSALKFIGYNDQAASAIAAQGAVAVEMAVDAGQRAMAKGKDINTLLTLPNIGEDIESTEEELRLTIDGPTETTGSMFSPETYSMLYGEPDKIANSYGERLAQITQKQAKLTEDSEDYKELERQKNLILDDVKRYNEAQREEKGEDEPKPTIFGGAVLETITNGITQRAMNKAKFDFIDIDKALVKREEGDEGRFGVALMSVAEELDRTYGYMDDQAMQNKIEFTREEAAKNLREYGLDVAAKTGSSYRKSFSNAREAMSAVQNKNVKIGDVLVYNDNGVEKIVVYTGFIDPVSGVPLLAVN